MRQKGRAERGVRKNPPTISGFEENHEPGHRSGFKELRTASKKTEIPVLQSHETEFCQQLKSSQRDFPPWLHKGRKKGRKGGREGGRRGGRQLSDPLLSAL